MKKPTLYFHITSDIGTVRYIIHLQLKTLSTISTRKENLIDN